VVKWVAVKGFNQNLTTSAAKPSDFGGGSAEIVHHLCGCHFSTNAVKQQRGCLFDVRYHQATKLLITL
jgi:hypothetical protein